MAIAKVYRQSRSTSLLSISHELRTKAITGLYRRTEVLHGMPVWNVSTRRKGPRPETRRRDLLGRDRDETRDAQVRDRDETETLRILSETRPRGGVSTSRDGLESRDRDVETETTSLQNICKCFSMLNTYGPQWRWLDIWQQAWDP